MTKEIADLLGLKNVKNLTTIEEDLKTLDAEIDRLHKLNDKKI